MFERAWETYLWTFEGFIITPKKRDAYGNVIPEGEGDREEGKADDSKEKSLQDKATDAASEIAQNVQKNISTIKGEAPKLIQMGQQITGVSTKEELREWVGEQLKLGTACLTEFMRGYRKGRDEEVDRMLHQYFKELDDPGGAEKNMDKKGASQVADSRELGKEEELADDGERRTTPKREKRNWGRRERRRAKTSISRQEYSTN